MNSDTICAVSTPAGVGGIAVVRVSGPAAIETVDSLWRGKPLRHAETHTAHFGTIVDPATGEEVDQAVATLFRGPKSFTGEDTVELSVHGSLWLQREVVDLICRVSAGKVRPAEPGEFTRRAFLSGNLDLVQAEAVADIIAADSAAAHRVASSQLRGGFSMKLAEMRTRLVELASLLELELDFSEEEVEFASREKLIALSSEIVDETERLSRSFSTGDAILHGVSTAIIGPTNVGKSSLLNALTGDDRAIVSDIHGTTRDIVEDTVTIDGIRFRLRDTAGLRHTDDTIENIGISRSRAAAASARLLLIVTAADSPATWTELTEGLELPEATILVINKSDLNPAGCGICGDVPDGIPAVTVSARTGVGLDHLRSAMVAHAGAAIADSNALIVTNARHAEALNATTDALRRLIAALRSGIPTDLAAEDLRDALHHLGTITGAITTPQILTTIFTRFCIGK